MEPLRLGVEGEGIARSIPNVSPQFWAGKGWFRVLRSAIAVVYIFKSTKPRLQRTGGARPGAGRGVSVPGRT